MRTNNKEYLRIAEVMQERGIRNNDIAEILGTSAVYVSEVARGNGSCSLRTLRKFADAIGCTMAELIADYKSPDF